MEQGLHNGVEIGSLHSSKKLIEFMADCFGPGWLISILRFWRITSLPFLGSGGSVRF